MGPQAQRVKDSQMPVYVQMLTMASGSYIFCRKGNNQHLKKPQHIKAFVGKLL